MTCSDDQIINIVKLQSYSLTRRERGAKWPAVNLNTYFSATGCPIELKPTWIFKFVCCLEVYEKKLINLDRGGTLEGLLSARVPQNQPRRVNFRVHLQNLENYKVLLKDPVRPNEGP